RPDAGRAQAGPAGGGQAAPLAAAATLRHGPYPSPHPERRPQHPPRGAALPEPLEGRRAPRLHPRPVLAPAREAPRDPRGLVAVRAARGRGGDDDRPGPDDDRPGLALEGDGGGARAGARLLVEPGLRVRSGHRDPARAPLARPSRPGEPVRGGKGGRPGGPARLLPPGARHARLHPAGAVPPRAARGHAAQAGEALPVPHRAWRAGAGRRLRAQPVHRDPSRVAVHDHGRGRGPRPPPLAQGAVSGGALAGGRGAAPALPRSGLRRVVRRRARRAPGRPAPGAGGVSQGPQAGWCAHPHHAEPSPSGQPGGPFGASLQPGPPERAFVRRGPRAAGRGGLRDTGGHRPAPGAGPQLALAAPQARPLPAPLEPPLGGALHARAAGGGISCAALLARSDLRRAAKALIYLAAASWVLLVVRWFDAAAPFRPAWLASVPPAVLALF